MADRYEVRRIDEFPALELSELNMTWRPVRRTLGITAFGMNAYTGDTGRHVVEPHTESALGHEEVYVVLRGLAQFTLGGDEVVAGPGTLVYLREPDTKREAVALEDGTTVLAIGGKPGEAYRPSAWEWWFAAAPLRDAGDLEGALAIVQEGLAEQPEHPVMLYQIACYESLLGRHADALEHLRLAVAGLPRTREWARQDDDFASLRDDPEFLVITGQAEAGRAGT
jgi:quercetin dioxygenase-like cupin family protein